MCDLNRLVRGGGLVWPALQGVTEFYCVTDFSLKQRRGTGFFFIELFTMHFFQHCVRMTEIVKDNEQLPISQDSV